MAPADNGATTHHKHANKLARWAHKRLRCIPRPPAIILSNIMPICPAARLMRLQ
jgi:hypothetical protein